MHAHIITIYRLYNIAHHTLAVSTIIVFVLLQLQERQLLKSLKVSVRVDDLLILDLLHNASTSEFASSEVVHLDHYDF